MSDPLLESRLKALATKRRIFVSYHHGGDQAYYDTFSSVMTSVYVLVHDRSLDRAVDSSDSDYVMRRIRENHISGTSCTIVLCGASTPDRKYVDWELKATLDKGHGLVGIALPTAQVNSSGVVVPGRFYDNYASGYAKWLAWSDLDKGAVHVKSVIEAAVSSSTSLVSNSRAMRSRNG